MCEVARTVHVAPIECFGQIGLVYVFVGQRGRVVVRGFVIFHDLCVERDFIAECAYILVCSCARWGRICGDVERGDTTDKTMREVPVVNNSLYVKPIESRIRVLLHFPRTTYSLLEVRAPAPYTKIRQARIGRRGRRRCRPSLVLEARSDEPMFRRRGRGRFRRWRSRIRCGRGRSAWVGRLFAVLG